MSIKTLKTGSVALALAVAILSTSLANPGHVGAWLAQGPLYQYPVEGGTWEYGFWNAHVRSYYTVDQCHGSTVVLNGDTVRSIDTAAGYTSYADKPAINYPGADDAYYYRVC